MYNVYKNNTEKRAVDGMTKIRYNAMDVKSIGLLIPIAIGLFIGVLYFMGGLGR